MNHVDVVFFVNFSGLHSSKARHGDYVCHEIHEQKTMYRKRSYKKCDKGNVFIATLGSPLHCEITLLISRYIFASALFHNSSLFFFLYLLKKQLLKVKTVSNF